MTTETIPINAPRSLKLTDEQHVALFEKYNKQPCAWYQYVKDHLLTDLLDVLGDPHAEAKKAWSQGKEIECKAPKGVWVTTPNPAWHHEHEYRPKPDAPWVPKVGDWVRVTGTHLTNKVFRVGKVKDGGLFESEEHAFGVFDRNAVAATAEEIATTKAKIKADKLAELDRETAQKRKQIEEECK